MYLHTYLLHNHLIKSAKTWVAYIDSSGYRYHVGVVAFILEIQITRE